MNEPTPRALGDAIREVLGISSDMDKIGRRAEILTLLSRARSLVWQQDQDGKFRLNPERPGWLMDLSPGGEVTVDLVAFLKWAVTDCGVFPSGRLLQAVRASGQPLGASFERALRVLEIGRELVGWEQDARAINPTPKADRDRAVAGLTSELEQLNAEVRADVPNRVKLQERDQRLLDAWEDLERKDKTLTKDEIARKIFDEKPFELGGINTHETITRIVNKMKRRRDGPRR